MMDLLILFAVTMAVSAVGWKYFVYFFSLGYGYGIAALAGTMGVMYHANMSVPTISMLVLLFIFGIRLGTYLLVRERKAVGYRKILYGEGHSDKKPAGVMIIDHTRVFDGYEGKGIARQLVMAAVDFARANSRKIIPVCSYTQAVLTRTDEYKDVLA